MGEVLETSWLRIFDEVGNACFVRGDQSFGFGATKCSTWIFGYLSA